MADERNSIMLLRDEGVQINTVSLMKSDPTQWSPEEIMVGSTILVMFEERLAERVKQVKAVAGALAKRSGVPPKGKPSGNPTLKIGGGSIRHETRIRREPRIDMIAKWARDNGVYDLLFPRMPVFQKDRFEEMAQQRHMEQAEYDGYFIEKPYEAVIIKKPADVVEFFERLEERDAIEGQKSGQPEVLPPE